MVNLGHISTDGTKIKANASNNYTLSKEEIDEIRKIIERGIAIDEEEDRLYGDKRGDELPPQYLRILFGNDNKRTYFKRFRQI